MRCSRCLKNKTVTSSSRNLTQASTRSSRPKEVTIMSSSSRKSAWIIKSRSSSKVCRSTCESIVKSACTSPSKSAHIRTSRITYDQWPDTRNKKNLCRKLKEATNEALRTVMKRTSHTLQPNSQLKNAGKTEVFPDPRA